MLWNRVSGDRIPITMADTDVVIVGAGLSGLTCARRLQESKLSCVVLEASDGIGGRVRTDVVEGFRLDRGFQVLLTAYPEVRRWLDLDGLLLCPFYSGAQVWFDGRFHRMADPFRRPVDAIRSILNPIGSIADKLRVAAVRSKACRGAVVEVFSRPETSTLDYLRQAGFTPRMIDRFFKPFLGGVFLDPGLRTSSRAFEFVFRMFAGGDSAVPALGMGQIPRALAAPLPAASIRLNSRVMAIKNRSVFLASGEEWKGRAVVLATDGPGAMKILGLDQTTGSRAVQSYYYAGASVRKPDPVLHLDGTGTGPFNSAVFMNEVSSQCAPSGQGLISATALGPVPVCEVDARRQLGLWFGEEVARWRLLKHYSIHHAQPDISQIHLPQEPLPARILPGIYACGDYRWTASIQGSMESGRLAAETVVADLA